MKPDTPSKPLETSANPHRPRQGRGAIGNPDSRYNLRTHDYLDDGWTPEEALTPIKTQVTVEYAKTIISRNDSPDIPFEQSVNAYRGCEHGCIYCYARPSHAFVGLSPGLDFETSLFAKPNASALLRKALGQKSYSCSPIALGANTDPYQPIERDRKITRGILELFQECRHPVTVTTKSALIERDADLLAGMAERNLAHVQISLTTLDRQLARLMEPRAASPERRLATIRRLRHLGIPVTVMIAPVIPFLTDAEMEALLEHAAGVGAQHANYIMLRLPLELNGLFSEWLEAHYPLKKGHVLSRLRDIHGGRIYESRFGVRQSGSGPFAELMRQRFRIALRRLRMDAASPQLDVTQFCPPNPMSRQMSLFEP